MLSLERYSKEYLVFLEFGESRSKNSLNSIRSDLKQFSNYCGELTDLQVLNDITPIIIRGFVSKLTKCNIGKRSINRKISILRAFFKYLVEGGEIKSNPAMLVDLHSFESELPEYITKEELDKIREVISLKNIHGLRDRLAIELLYSSGITTQELLSLGETLFDFDKREFIVKNGKHSRVVFYSERANALLKEYIQGKKEKFKDRYNRDILFVNGSSTRLSDRSLRRILERYAVKAGITREISPYMFRHAFGVYMLKNGMELEHIKVLMGHTSLLITKIYKKLVPIIKEGV